MNAKNLGEFRGDNSREIQSKIQSASEISSEIQNSRREFVKNSSKLAVASVAIGAMASVSPLLANANLARNESKNLSNSKASQNATNSNKGTTMTQNSQVWYITGASGGLGYELAKYLLEKGDKVAATSRKKGNLEKKFGDLAKSENFLALTLTFDKNIDKQVAQNIKAIQQKFGRLDNVVNNAGYGLLGFVEETSEKQLREQFEVNVFAPFIVAQNALKIMRPQAVNEGGNAKSVKARIYNLSSIAGFRVPSVSTPYSMSKFALSALSEGLNLDLKDFGIATINVMPGGFRTEFLGASVNLGELKIADYDKKREEFIKNTNAFNGKQAGNPAAFAKVIYETSRQAKPPFHLFMGDAAYKSARNKIEFVQNDMKVTESYAGKAVDFAGSAGSAFDKR